MANSPALTHILHRANGDAEFESGWPGKLTNSTQVLFLFTSEPDDDLAVRQAYCTFASFWNSSMWVTANIYGDKGRTLAAGRAIGDKIRSVLQEQFGSPARVLFNKNFEPPEEVLCKMVGVRSRYMFFETLGGQVFAFFRAENDAVQAMLALYEFNPSMELMPTKETA